MDHLLALLSVAKELCLHQEYISPLFNNDTFEINVLSNTNTAIDLCLEKQYDNIRETNKQTNMLFRPKPLVQSLPSELPIP